MDEIKGKKLTKSTSGLRMIPTGEKYASPFALEEPMWMPDRETKKCVGCKQVFDFLNRKHHCRRCGKCYCNRCCSNSINLQRMYFVDPVRQCYECAVISKKEQEFYERGLKVLMAGTIQNIVEETHNNDRTDLGNYLCRLSADYRYIEFSSNESQTQDKESLPRNVLLSKVTGAQILTDSQSESLNTKVATGLELKYKDEYDSAVAHHIILHPVDQKASMPWLIAAHKALKMIFESKAQSRIQ
ncbi:zinc finger FYVE domain-containing protein 21-like [Styela clava]